MRVFSALQPLRLSGNHRILNIVCSYVYEQQSVDVLPTTDAEAEQEERKRDTLLECVGSIHQRLVLQPTSLDSESHARMSLKISEKHKKESK